MEQLKQMIIEANIYIALEQPIQLQWGKNIFSDFREYIEVCEVEIVQKSDVDKHRWYGTQEVVFKLKNGDDVEFVSTRIVTQSYSEAQELNDIYWEYQEFEIVKPRKVITTIYDGQ